MGAAWREIFIVTTVWMLNLAKCSEGFVEMVHFSGRLPDKSGPGITGSLADCSSINHPPLFVRLRSGWSVFVDSTVMNVYIFEAFKWTECT
jgi:hypothetical protein